MLINTNHRSNLNFDDITFTVLDLCSFTNGTKMVNYMFLFYNLSLAQLNVMKLMHNAYYHKTQFKFEFCWRNFYCSRVMSLYKWKINDFIVSILN